MPDTDEGWASAEKVGDELKAWFLSGSSPVPFAYFDPILRYAVDGITKAAASIGETPMGLLSSLTTQLAILAGSGNMYDATPLVAAWGQNPGELDVVAPVGQELSGSPSVPENESGNAADRAAGKMPSPLNSEIVDGINAVMKDPTYVYKRVFEASDQELAQTAYCGRRLLSGLGKIFKIQWPDDEYLDILGALLGPMICVMFSDPDKPITSPIRRTFSLLGRVRLQLRKTTTSDIVHT